MTVFLDHNYLKYIFELEYVNTIQRIEVLKSTVEFNELEYKKELLSLIDKKCIDIKKIINESDRIIIDIDEYSNTNPRSEVFDHPNEKEEIIKKHYTSYKQILKRNLYSEVLIRKDNKFDDYNALYFLDKSLEKKDELSKSGVICEDNSSCSQLRSFDDYTFNIIPAYFNKLAAIQNKLPPSNAMIIFDPFIFGQPHDVKLENLLRFIKLHNCENINIDFHLTIFYCKFKGHEIFNDNHFDKVIDALKEVKNLKFELIKIRVFGREDRFIITNYGIIISGHPFENQRTTFSQRLELHRNNARIKKIIEYYTIRNKTQKKFIYRSDPDFSNRLFSQIL